MLHSVTLLLAFRKLDLPSQKWNISFISSKKNHFVFKYDATGWVPTFSYGLLVKYTNHD